ncbi:hypothetical protein J5226_19680 [Lysobacter sp. K5869]|uniref:J domain-containing protein n=1 Tax=Lysobacter sp. K5869 TaxID=2820808 RepID=UPI001C05FA01|nr:J domain-containing protein [Lysobacter sp. K5869]QWP75807.1 hypothetical protein J5226_19680 [Lysobacter sp. K5869]
MTPHQRLGIGRDADEREIKRAYARELKRCRPDENPEGFQVLQEAYRYCLEYATQVRLQFADGGEDEDEDEGYADDDEAAAPAPFDGADDPAAAQPQAYSRTLSIAELAAELAANEDRARADDDAPRTGDASPDETASSRPQAGRPPATASESAATIPQLAAEFAAEPAPEPPPQLHFDGEAFLQELLQRGSDHGPTALTSWLQSLEPLYSLDLKHALRAPLAQVLAELEPPLPPDALGAIFAFFALDQTGPREAQLFEFAHRAQARAEAALAFERALAQRSGSRGNATERLLLRELRGPASLPRRLWIALFPGLPSRVMNVAGHLLQIDRERALRLFDRGSFDYWRAVTDPARIAWPRVFVALLRVLLYPLPLAVLLHFDGSPAMLARLPQVWLVLGLAWIASSLIRAVWLQWRISLQHGQPTPLWRDAPLQLFVGAAVAVAVIAPTSSPFAALIAVGAGWLWTLGRGRDRIGRTLAAFAAGLVISASVPFAIDTALGLPERAPPDAWMPLFLIGAAAAPVLQDVYVAATSRIGLAQARLQARPPWVALAAAVAAIVARNIWGV